MVKYRSAPAQYVPAQYTIALGLLCFIALSIAVWNPVFAHAAEKIEERYDNDPVAKDAVPFRYDNDAELMAAGVAEAEGAPSVKDPFERLNRGVFFVNDVVDGMILAPIATAYVDLVPKWGQARVSSVIDTLKQPIYLINYVLQGDRMQASRTLRRFGYNSTFGVFGLFDVASKRDLHNLPTDAGLTLAHYCADSGPYVVIPLLGPSNMRDAVGIAADTLLFDPARYLMHQKYYRYRMEASALDARAKALDFTQDIDSITLDKYSSMRSMYTQHRAYALQNAMQHRSSKCASPRGGASRAVSHEAVSHGVPGNDPSLQDEAEQEGLPSVQPILHTAPSAETPSSLSKSNP